MLYLCGKQVLLKAMKSWIGEGGKALSVGASDTNIVLPVELAATKKLRKMTSAEAATFLVKVKAH